MTCHSAEILNNANSAINYSHGLIGAIFAMFEFEIKNGLKKARSTSSGRARAGVLKTPHGKLETPNLAIVATNGTIKLFDDADYKKAKPELTISNTFHLFVNKKVPEIKKAGGIHKWAGLKNPIMTDSGGFQVFSLGWGKTHGIGKVAQAQIDSDQTRINSDIRFKNQSNQSQNRSKSASVVKIFEHEVIFNFNNREYELTPEKSIKLQKDIGADIIFAFDECTSPLHDHAYNKKAMERTHCWALRCLKEFKQSDKQALFGIVQGGIYEDLRKKSSQVIGAMPFGGFGIGGSFGEKQMKKVLGWALSGLPQNKPRHLLGIGKINDVFIAVKQGIDLFDCVIPTREARHARIYIPTGTLDINKEIFKKDKKLIDKNCGCWVCKNKISRGELREYFKTDKLKGQKLAMTHNIWFYKNLFAEIRIAIEKGKMEKLEGKYYNHL